MSIDALKWAWEQQCPSASSKLVLVALADHANGDGYCWPSMKRIGRMAGLSDRTVAYHIAHLCEAGLVEKAHRKRYEGQYRGWHYRLPIPDVDAPTTSKDLPVATGKQLQVATGNELPVRTSSKNSQKNPRERDVLFEAIVSACGHRLNALTKSERGRINKAAKELRDVGATPETVRKAATKWQSVYPTARLTPTALAHHWSTLVGNVAWADPAAAQDVCSRCSTPLDRHDDQLCELFGR